MMSKQEYLVNQREYKQIMTAKNGVFIPRLEVFINRSAISTAYPENKEIDKRDQQIGVLHDGTKVRRHFGEWIEDKGFVPDDKGNYVPVRLNRDYYPEVALDIVPTVQKYKKIKHLPLAERKKIICGDRIQRIESQEPEQIKSIMGK